MSKDLNKTDTSKSKSKEKKKTESSDSPKKIKKTDNSTKDIKDKSKEKSKDKSKEKDKLKDKIITKKSTVDPSVVGDNKTVNNDNKSSVIDPLGKLVKLDHSDINYKNSLLNKQSNEKCEGCFELDGNCFCLHCEKVYCKTCEDHIHNIPVNSNHERVSIFDVPHLKKLCYHHNLALKFFCESCEEPVCNECHTTGPHNNKLHRVSNVIESYRKKSNYINNLITKNITIKLDQLVNQIQSLEFNIEQVKQVKESIEKDIRNEYSSMLESIKGEEGKKMGILQNESAIIQKEISQITELINITNEVAYSERPDVLSFLLRYRHIKETIETCMAKPLRSNYI